MPPVLLRRSPRRRIRLTSYRPKLESLEDRNLLSTLDVTGGSLNYSATAGINNNLTIGVSGTSYTFDDTGEAITLTTNAINAGWTGSGTNSVSGPTSSVTTDVTVNLQDNLADLLTVNANVTVAGNLSLQSGGDISLAFTVQATTVTLDAGNTITAATGAGLPANKIAATNLALTAVNEIGTPTVLLPTAVSNLVARTTTFFAPGIFLSNTGTLTIGYAGDPFRGVGVQGSGSIVLTNTGTVNITNSGETVTTGGGPITITSTAGDIVTGGNQFDVTIGGTSALVTLNARGNIDIGSNGQSGSIAGGGPVLLSAVDSIFIDEGSSVQSFGFGSPGNGVTITSTLGDIFLRATTVPGASIFTQAGGGDINLTTGPGRTFFLNSGGGIDSTSASGDGNITITTDNILIDDTVTAGSGIVTIQPVSPGRPLDLGAASSGSRLALSDVELNRFTAGVLRFGNASAGDLSVTDLITAHAGYNTLSLITGGAIIDAHETIPFLDIVVTNLALQAANGIGDGTTLDVGVGTVAARNTTSGLIQLAQNDGPLTVGTVDGVVGITNDALLGGFGTDVVRSDNGNLTIDQNISSSGSHNLELTAAGADSTLTNNAVVTTSGQLNLTADRMALNPGSALVGINGPNIIFEAFSSGRLVDLGSTTDVAPNTLELSDAELDTLSGASGLVIGQAGAITVSAPISIDPASANTVVLGSNGTITNGPAGTLAVTNLNVQSADAVSLIGNNQVSGNLSGTVLNSGQSFTFTNAQPLIVGNAGGVLGITTNNGDIILSADDMTIAEALNAVDHDVTLRPLTPGQPIDVGGAGAGSRLALDNAELNLVTAGRLRLGVSGAGPITVTTAVAPANTGTLILENSSAITQNAGATITIPNLGLVAFGPVVLDQANDVTTGSLAALISGAGQGLTFTDANNLTIALPSGGTAISMTGGPLNLTTLNGKLTVSNDIQVGGGTTLLTAGGAESILTANALIVTSGGSTMRLAANRMALAGSPGLFAFGGGRIILQPTTALRGIVLGPTTDPTGTLNLSDAELDKVNTSGVLQIGSLISGGVDVSGSIDNEGQYGSLTIISGLNGLIGGSGMLTQPALALRTGNGVNLSGVNAVGTLAGSAGGFAFNNNGPLIVGTVDGVTGITTTSASVNVGTTGNLTINNNITSAAALFLSALGANSLLTNAAAVSGTSATLSADRMALGGTINVGSAPANFVILQPTSAAQPINFDDTAGDPNGELRLSNAELATITAGVLRAFTAGVTAGINIRSVVTAPAGWNTLSLFAGAAISDNAGGALRVPNLAVQGASGVTLVSPNTLVGQIAGSSVANFTVSNSNSLTIGTVDGMNGIQGNSISIFLAPVANVLLTVDQPVTILPGSTNVSIFLIADDMAINAAVTAVGASGAGRVVLQPASKRDIDLGGAGGPTLGLTDAELDRVTAGVLSLQQAIQGHIVLGGNIVFTAPIDAEDHYRQLTLTADAILGLGSPTPDVTVPSLALQGGVGTPAAPLFMDVGTLFASSGSPRDLFLKERDGSTANVGSLDAYGNTIVLEGGGFAVGTANIRSINSLNVAGPTAVLQLGDGSQTVAGVTLTDGSISGTTGVLTSLSNFDLRNGTVRAILAGTVGMTKSTAGTVTLAGANTFAGPTTLTGGTLIVNGSVAGSVSAQSGTTLAGVGTVGPFSGAGGAALSPGTGPNSPGIFTTGNTTLASGFSFVADLLGVAPTQFDSLHSTGSVDLGGATLNLVVGPTFPTDVSASLTLVHAAALRGTFAGLPNGSTIQKTVGGTPVTFTIHYTPTDVVLTLGTGPTPPLSRPEQFVEALYREELGRDANFVVPNDGNLWVNALVSGALTQAQVAAAVQHSLEARSYLVGTWYLHFLGRPAQGSEASGWITLLSAGAQEEFVLSAILGSAEFQVHAQAVAPDGTPQQDFVQALYGLVLNRQGSAAEVSGWFGLLNTFGERVVAFGFLKSIEYRIDVVNDLYAHLLQRTPSPQELDAWVFSNLDLGTIRLQFESSPEFP